MNGWEILVSALAAVIVAILVWMVFGASGYIRGRKLARLADRRSVGDDDFYDRYYRSSGLTKDLVVKLRHELGAALDLSPIVLLPADRFETELAVVKGWWYLDDSPDELVLLNRERERRLGVHIPIENIRTVDDYIRTIGSLEAGREALHRL